mmetsp:Transcript_28067/g.85765  ORF Transcript_28067/g.85765 Transcript_28067/m.85765 type:complete len:90 (-) Transcript_28067:7-276(-)|eukprot:scaffold226227_cov31-Tisochrysis_lutea.AAC.2
MPSSAVHQVAGMAWTWYCLQYSFEVALRYSTYGQLASGSSHVCAMPPLTPALSPHSFLQCHVSRMYNVASVVPLCTYDSYPNELCARWK